MERIRKIVSIVALMSLVFSQTAMFAASDGATRIHQRYYTEMSQKVKKNASWLRHYEKKAKKYAKLLAHYEAKYAKYEAKGQIRGPNLYDTLLYIKQYKEKLIGCQNWIKLIKKAMRETGQARGNFDVATAKRFEVNLSALDIYVGDKKIASFPNTTNHMFSWMDAMGNQDIPNAPTIKETGSRENFTHKTEIFFPAGTKFKVYFYNGKAEAISLQGTNGVTIACKSTPRSESSGDNGGGNSGDAAAGAGTAGDGGSGGADGTGNGTGGAAGGGSGGSGVWIPVQRLDLVHCSDFALPLRV